MGSAGGFCFTTLGFSLMGESEHIMPMNIIFDIVNKFIEFAIF